MLSNVKSSLGIEIENKINFFSDYYKLYNEHLGKYSYLEFENVGSLCEKILFQLENNPDHCHKYIKHHYQKQALLNEGPLLINYKHLKEFKKELKDFTLQNKNYTTYRINNSKLVKRLKLLVKELKKKELSEAIKLLYKYLRCSCVLNQHIEDIRYLSKVIVVDIRYNQRSKDEVNRLLSNIFSKNRKALPLNKKNSQLNKEQKESLLQNISFWDQLEGIINYSKKETVNGYYIWRIQNLKLPISKTIKFHECEVLNPSSKKLSGLSTSSRSQFWKEFYTENDSVICISTANLDTEYGQGQSFQKARHIVRLINSSINHNCQVFPYRCLTTVNFRSIGIASKRNDSNAQITSYQLEKIYNHSATTLLGINSSSATKHFLNLEEYYFRAKDSNQLSDYWVYLESIIPNILVHSSSKSQYVDQVHTTCLNILTDHYIRTIKHDIADTIFSKLCFSFSPTRSFSKEDKDSLESHYTPSSVIIRSRHFKIYPIIKYLHEQYEKCLTTQSIEKQKQYLAFMLKQLYASRNSIVHSGRVSSFSNNASMNIIDRHMRIIRSYFITELKGTKRASMINIVRKINNKTSKYIDNKLNQ